MIDKILVFIPSAVFGFAVGFACIVLMAKAKKKNCSYLRIENPAEVRYIGPIDEPKEEAEE